MKITFVTFHNWETRRIGGFHKLAEASVMAGHEVNFFSFSRPYFSAIKNEERLNKNILIRLSKGVEYNLDRNRHSLINFTWPTLQIPNPIHKLIPNFINHWCQTHSFTPFSVIQKKFLSGTDIFVFESCEGLEIFDIIKKYNPNAKFVYRPSDPLMIDGCRSYERKIEEHVMRNVSMNYIVNQSGVNLYRRKILDFDKSVKYIVLPNGVDTEAFKEKYDCPPTLNKPNTFLYVGARIIEWPLIQKAATERPNYNFIIVCPEIPPIGFDDIPNITYIRGIKPSEVPAWVTNCDVIIVPNPKGWYKVRPWGITAKYYQAMEARRPIVAFEDTEELKAHEVFVAYDYETFIEMLGKALIYSSGFDYDFNGNSWKVITNKFLTSLSEIR